MENIIVVTPGIEPTIYYTHNCTQCAAKLQIKASMSNFKCPCCESAETLIPSAETQVKIYGTQKQKSPREKESNKKLKLKK